MTHVFIQFAAGNAVREMLISGGAKGADRWWAEAALEAGRKVHVTSFHGHAVDVPPGCTVLKLDDKMRDVEDDVSLATRQLGRNMPRDGYVRSLLLRSVFQVRDVDSVVAVGHMEPGGGSSSNVRVKGGTAYACQMYANRIAREWGEQKAGQRRVRRISLFLYNIEEECWQQARIGATSGVLETVEWMPVELAAVVAGRGRVFAGIGARDVSNEAVRADMREIVQ